MGLPDRIKRGTTRKGLSKARLRLFSGVAALAFASGTTTIMAGAASSRSVHQSGPRSHWLVHRPRRYEADLCRHLAVATAVGGRDWRHKLILLRRCRGVRLAGASIEGARMASTVPATSPRPYETSVDPGSAIQFLSPTVGWRVDGIYAAPWLAGELSSGPSGTTIDWPGASVSKSTDGGASWNVIGTGQDAVWGIDFLSPDVGWVVGVSSLVGTSDGGSTWQTLGEPAGDPLVRAQFTSPSDGFGVSASGQLVQTADGGVSWQNVPLSVSATALCVATSASSSVAYVADEQGDVFRSADGGATWSEDYQSTIPSVYHQQIWSELACDADSVWEGIRVISPSLRQEAFLLARRSTSSSSWIAIVSSSAGGPALSPAEPGSDGLQSLQGVSTYQGSAILAGIPTQGFTAALTSVSASQAAVSVPAYPTVPASPSLDALTTDPINYMRVLGVSSIGAEAWVYLVDGAAGGNTPSYDTIVVATDDGGGSWSVVNDSGPLSQPQGP